MAKSVAEMTPDEYQLFKQLWPERAAILETPVSAVIVPPPAISADPWAEVAEIESSPEHRLERAEIALLQAEVAYKEALAVVAPKRTRNGRRRMAEESARRMESPLNGNDDFSLLKKPAAQVQRGFDIRYQVTGGPGWMNERAHGYAPLGELPVEWAQICADPTVERAVIFPSNQRAWQAQKRRNIAEYTRQTVLA